MMLVAQKRDIRQTPVWNEVKNWGKEDKVGLITLLSLSLAELQSSEETPEEKTKRMIEKYSGCWTGSDSAEDTIRLINEGKHSSMEPLKF